MKKLFFRLSMEHRTLPISEVLAILESEGCSYEITLNYPGLLVLKSEPRTLESVKKRSAYVKYGGYVLHYANNINTLIDDLRKKFILEDLPSDKTFCVRVDKLGGKEIPVNSVSIERKIGAIIVKKTNLHVDLEKPDIRFNVIISPEASVLGVESFRIRRRIFEKRRPSKRPFFHPSTLHPVLAKALVNLSRARRGSIIVDPFCGAGGILIEAALLGYHVVGCDVLSEMAHGAKLNLKHFNIWSSSNLIVSDSEKLVFREKSIDYIVTDTPYGRLSTTKGKDLDKLMEKFVARIARALRKGGRAVIMVDSRINIEQIIARNNLKILEKHLIRVHRSLTRKIVVAEV
ncbi:MAG: hypothetical protein DRJ32_00590 [Thermoprotei archaeon]|nr:MAG: hypothetical protein DRJ32_00590 [Thermoprotei archaeon]